MIKKMKYAAAPLLLALALGACSGNEEAAQKEEPAEAAEQATAEQQTKLKLPAEEDVVVVVNDEDILGNVYNSVARQLESSLATQGKDTAEAENADLVKEQAITVIVGNKLILQDAAKKGYEAEDAAVEERLEELKGQFESEEAMNDALKKSGYTMEDMESQLREQITYENYVAKEVKPAEVTDKEVQAAYDGFAETAKEEAPAFEEMEPTIRQSLEQQNTQQAVADRIEELKKTAKIDVKI
ncbi:SurA N-terminal domain-containing protein [Planococcus shenhongbingii]|uniref:SurA N-terminal domain-containing protein n=1 Tax=Planococcus shenhongbingii TaxID=3058398 RepID=A0ABT8NFZ9_9BACL|nr:SurA N-terminal domain-containing protein [Planococcus sp. N017]MDN7246823.1 SurA N-terminal domain-containing protein [Planococcus sp. N017]